VFKNGEVIESGVTSLSTRRHLDQAFEIIGELFHDQHELQSRVFREILQLLESLLLCRGQRRILVSAEILVFILSVITDP